MIHIDNFLLGYQPEFDKSKGNSIETPFEFSGKALKLLRNLVHLLYTVASIEMKQIPESFQITYGSFLEKIITVFEKTGILFSAFPDLPNQKEDLDFSLLWAQISKDVLEDQTHLRKGGVFYCLVPLVFEALNVALTNPHLKFQRLTLLSRLLFPLRKKSKVLFNASNKNFRKLFDLTEVSSVKKDLSGEFCPWFASQPYDIFLYKLLETIDLQLIIQPNQAEDKFINELVLFLKELLETSGADYSSKLTNQALIGGGFRSQIMGITKLKKFEKSEGNMAMEHEEISFSFDVAGASQLRGENIELKNEFLEFGHQFNQDFQLLNRKNKVFHDNLMLSGGPEPVLRSSEDQIISTHSRSLEQTPVGKLEFFTAVREILSKRYADMSKTLSAIIEEFLLYRDEVMRIVRPLLELICYRCLGLVERLERFRQRIYEETNQSEEPRMPKNFALELGLDEDWKRYFEKECFRFKNRFMKRCQSTKPPPKKNLTHFL